MSSVERANGGSAGRGRGAGTPEALYGLGIIGAWIWFWGVADGFWGHVWALVQGIFWPAYMVYDAFDRLHH